MDKPSWELPAPIKVVAKRPPKRAKRVDDQAPVSLILPDAQIGFYAGPNGKRIPTHDPAAIEAATLTLEWLAQRRPIKAVVHLGDDIDMPEAGKYKKSPAFPPNCNEALAVQAERLGTERSITDAPIRWHQGNHERRLDDYLADNAMAAFGIRMNGDPSQRPVLSIPHLLNLDELGVEFIDGYPSDETWLADDLVCVHGHRHGQNAGNAYLSHESVSLIHGHSHRFYKQCRTTRTPSGPRVQIATSPGTLARIDGAVPSVLSGTDRNGCQVHRVEPWEQGVAIVQHFDDGSWVHDNCHIFDGVAHVWGTQIAA